MLEPRLVHTGCIGHNATLGEFIVDGCQTFAPKDLAPLIVPVARGSTHGQGDDGPFLKCEDDRGVIVDTGLLELLEGGGSSGEYAFDVVIQGIPDVIDIMSLCKSTFLDIIRYWLDVVCDENDMDAMLFMFHVLTDKSMKISPPVRRNSMGGQG